MKTRIFLTIGILAITLGINAQIESFSIQGNKPGQWISDSEWKYDKYYVWELDGYYCTVKQYQSKKNEDVFAIAINKRIFRVFHNKYEGTYEETKEIVQNRLIAPTRVKTIGSFSDGTDMLKYTFGGDDFSIILEDTRSYGNYKVLTLLHWGLRAELAKKYGKKERYNSVLEIQ